jgi:RNA polymerase sigma factor (sigma-70 family)
MLYATDPHSRLEPSDSPAENGLCVTVAAAVSGNELAWRELVQRFDGRLRAAARAFRLAPADVDDVVQATWEHALQTLPALREPRAVGAWLTTMVRRESLRSLQRRTREVPEECCEPADQADSVDAAERLIAAERRAALGRAIATLPERHRALMVALGAEECPDYQAIAARLGMPAGSIGPIRARSLDRLRRHPELVAFAPRG